MVNFHDQCEWTENSLEDKPLDASVRVSLERFNLEERSTVNTGTSIPWARVLG